MDLAREDMERVGAKEVDEVDREKWKILSRCDDSKYGEAKITRGRRRSLANATIINTVLVNGYSIELLYFKHCLTFFQSTPLPEGCIIFHRLPIV